MFAYINHKHRIMNKKSVGTVLLIGSIIWLVSNLFWFGQNIYFGYSSVINTFFSFLSIFPPVSLLLFSVFFKQSNDNLIQKNEGLKSDSSPMKNLTIGEWMLNYLIMSIPLIGFIFLIIWATDQNNVIRKNWAASMLIWFGVIIVIYLLFFMAFMSNSFY